MIRKSIFGLIICVSLVPLFARNAVAWWSFDESRGNLIKDISSGEEDEIRGNYWLENGVKGSCLKLDGYTTHILRKAEKAPELEGSFTIEAWVAPQTYPWNWTAIVDRERGHRKGFFFGLDARGYVGLGVVPKSDGEWIKCVSENNIEPLVWSHIAATYHESGKIELYINGNKNGEYTAKKWLGSIKSPDNIDLWIGRSHRKMYPEGTEREPSRNQLSNMIFDGLIDEVKIYDYALDGKQIKKKYKTVKPDNLQPLNWRQFPKGGATSQEFGAYYTKLNYDETWDRLWRMGDNSDIVVTFEKPIRVVFWRGINYAASYVTENEIWMGDQSLECGSSMGCNEHMSDKQCRYARVRLLENNDARVIVHWRYALADIKYQIANKNALTNWGDWADEYFVIYPDGVVVRHQVLWSSNFGEALNTADEPEDGESWHQFQETILFNQPGTWPQDNVDPVEPLTVATMKGETYTCKWGGNIELSEEEIVNHEVVKDATIQMTNLKSKYKPFIIFEPGSIIAPWVDEELPIWNHWPVAQLPSDGRWTPSNDRPSHTSLSCGVPVVHEGEGNSHVAVMLYGLTESSIKNLVPLARSWNYPPDLKVIEGDITYMNYDKYQRAYILQCNNKADMVQIELAGTADNPIVNPVIILKDWGESKVKVNINSNETEALKDFRSGYTKGKKSKDLIVWLKDRSQKTRRFNFIPVTN